MVVSYQNCADGMDIKFEPSGSLSSTEVNDNPSIDNPNDTTPVVNQPPVVVDEPPQLADTQIRLTPIASNGNVGASVTVSSNDQNTTVRVNREVYARLRIEILNVETSAQWCSATITEEDYFDNFSPMPPSKQNFEERCTQTLNNYAPIATIPNSTYLANQSLLRYTMTIDQSTDTMQRLHIRNPDSGEILSTFITFVFPELCVSPCVGF